MGDNRTETVRFWIDQMLQKEGINKYTLDVSGSSLKGDGYMGDIIFVKVDCDLVDDGKKVYDIVIKANKLVDDDDENKLPLLETFQRELQMYTEVFPAVENLQIEYATENTFSGYAQCYWTCTTKKREAILLKNLKSLNYLVHDRKIPQNFDHTMVVFRNYAIWHGSTIALRLKKPDLFKKVTRGMYDIFGKTIIEQNWKKLYEVILQNAIALLRKRGNTLAAEKFENANIDVLKVMAKLSLHDDDEAKQEAVILHGDCWNNNMMFKYEKNNASKPIDVKFLDFQLTRVGSPIMDLSYYLYTTTDKLALDKFDDLLEEYHKTLSSYLRQFDINCDDILPLEKLKKTWKKYGQYGLVLCTMLVRVEMSEQDEIIDFANNNIEQLIDIVNTPMKYQEEYERRLYIVFSHFAERFL